VVRCPFPLAIPDDSGKPHQVDVSLGPVPLALDEARLRGPRFQACQGRFLYYPEPGCRILVLDGVKVSVAIAEPFSTELLPGYFEQAILAALLHQRGLLPLHASAVRVDGKAQLFLGKSRAGKSSAAALLTLDGYDPICDDVCAVEAPTIGYASVSGASGYLKIPAELSDQFSSYDLQRLVEPDRERFRVHLGSAGLGATPIEHLTVLEASLDGQFEWSCLAPQEALEELVKHTYRPRLVRGLGVRSTHWKQCCQLAASAQVHKLIYPCGLEGLREGLKRARAARS
jgi:hypothetical protein